MVRQSPSLSRSLALAALASQLHTELDRSRYAKVVDLSVSIRARISFLQEKRRRHLQTSKDLFFAKPVCTVACRTLDKPKVVHTLWEKQQFRLNRPSLQSSCDRYIQLLDQPTTTATATASNAFEQHLIRLSDESSLKTPEDGVFFSGQENVLSELRAEFKPSHFNHPNMAVLATAIDTQPLVSTAMDVSCLPHPEEPDAHTVDTLAVALPADNDVSEEHHAEEQPSFNAQNVVTIQTTCVAVNVTNVTNTAYFKDERSSTHTSDFDDSTLHDGHHRDDEDDDFLKKDNVERPLTPPSSLDEPHADRTQPLARLITVQKKRAHGLRSFLTRAYHLSDVTVYPRHTTADGLLLGTSAEGQPKAILKLIMTTALNDRIKSRFGFSFSRDKRDAHHSVSAGKYLGSISGTLVVQALELWVESQPKSNISHCIPNLSHATHIMRRDQKIYIVYDTSDSVPLP